MKKSKEIKPSLIDQWKLEQIEWEKLREQQHNWSRRRKRESCRMKYERNFGAFSYSSLYL